MATLRELIIKISANSLDFIQIIYRLKNRLFERCKFNVINFHKIKGLVVLSEILLHPMEWFDAADMIVKGMEGAIVARGATCNFERLMDGPDLMKFPEFFDAIISHM